MKGEDDSGGSDQRSHGDVDVDVDVGGGGGGAGSGSEGSATERDTTERMRCAIAALAAGNGSVEELQTAARALVSDLRQHDEPPEKMLLTIKAILGSAGLRSGLPIEDGAPPDPQAAVYRDVIVWSIRAYYEGR